MPTASFDGRYIQESHSVSPWILWNRIYQNTPYREPNDFPVNERIVELIYLFSSIKKLAYELVPFYNHCLFTIEGGCIEKQLFYRFLFAHFFSTIHKQLAVRRAIRILTSINFIPSALLIYKPRSQGLRKTQNACLIDSRTWSKLALACLSYKCFDK